MLPIFASPSPFYLPSLSLFLIQPNMGHFLSRCRRGWGDLYFFSWDLCYWVQYKLYSLLIMFQTASDLPNSNALFPAYNSTTSFPTIPRQVASSDVSSLKEQLNKQKLVLPSLYDAQQQAPGEDRNKENVVNKNKASFAKEMKDRLNLVLGEMPNSDNNGICEEPDSDDMDFEEKINQNKEIIKEHRRRRQNQRNSDSQRNRLGLVNDDKTKRDKKTRNESLYEKRMRQYRDQSGQNRYLQKKKQNIKQQNPTPVFDDYRLQDIRETKSKLREESKLEKNSRNKKASVEKPVSMGRVLSQRSSHKNLVSAAKNTNINLFDCIQNFLENPRQNKKQINKPLVGLTLLKAKRDIEDKIKQLNDKLGIRDEPGKNYGTLLTTETAREWRRVEIGSKQIDCKYSTFDKELDRINQLQERNSICLQKYLEHQKLLLDLELRRSETMRLNANSH